MKAIVVRRYGGPEVLSFEEVPDPVAASDEVLIRIAATSINPFDSMRRSGMAKDFAPIAFPGIVGVDVAGTVVSTGSGVRGFRKGDAVLAMADRTYAELCVVKAANVVKLPEGLDLIEAAALPLVTTTGNELITQGAKLTAGQTVIVAGAVGNVGRSAVFAARDLGARVIAGVLKRQLNAAASLGAAHVVATDDEDAVASLAPVDAVADTVGGKTAEKLLAKVKPGGVFATTLGPPPNARDYPGIRVVPITVQPDGARLLYMVTAIRDGKFVIPIDRKIRLEKAAEGQAAAQKGGIGKVLLLT